MIEWLSLTKTNDNLYHTRRCIDCIVQCMNDALNADNNTEHLTIFNILSSLYAMVERTRRTNIQQEKGIDDDETVVKKRRILKDTTGIIETSKVIFHEELLEKLWKNMEIKPMDRNSILSKDELDKLLSNVGKDRE